MTLVESVYKRLLEFAYEDSRDINTVKHYAKKICDDFHNVVKTEEFAEYFHSQENIKED